MCLRLPVCMYSLASPRGVEGFLDKKAPIFNEDFGFRHQFLSVCSTLQEHALKMCLGPTSSITATFDDYQVIHCYHSSLILTIIASNEALTGQLMNLSSTLKPLITDMAKHVLPAVA